MTIEHEIFEILQAPVTVGGRRINQIADEFRTGRDAHELIELLDSPNAEIVSLGAWILGEIATKFYNFHPFISRLWKLTDHDDCTVRFNALGALFPVLNWRDTATRNMVEKLRGDHNEGVRKRAEAIFELLSNE